MAGSSLDQAEFAKELLEFNHHYNAVRLLGTDHVGAAAERLAAAYFAIYDVSGLGMDESWAQSFVRFKSDYVAQYSEFKARRKPLLDSRTSDVGPT
jgi:hypothetical protein